MCKLHEPSWYVSPSVIAYRKIPSFCITNIRNILFFLHAYYGTSDCSMQELGSCFEETVPKKSDEFRFGQLGEISIIEVEISHMDGIQCIASATFIRNFLSQSCGFFTATSDPSVIIAFIRSMPTIDRLLCFNVQLRFNVFASICTFLRAKTASMPHFPSLWANM